MKMVTLLSTDRLKSNTPIEENVDDSLLKPYIHKAQLTHIHQFLGTNLYDKILLLVGGGTISDPLNSHYKTLLDDYIQPALIEYSFYEVLPFISLKITNKTIGRGNAEFLSEGDLSDLKYLRNIVLDLAEFQGQRLIGHLKENNTLFPEYFTNYGLDKILPNSKSYFNGIYMGGGRSRNYGDDDNWTWGMGIGIDL